MTPAHLIAVILGAYFGLGLAYAFVLPAVYDAIEVIVLDTLYTLKSDFTPTKILLWPLCAWLTAADKASKWKAKRVKRAEGSTDGQESES